MFIAIIHNQITSEATPADRDVVAQADAVEEALARLGHRTFRYACSLDLDAAQAALTRLAPDLVFNLVESLGGSDRLMPLATLLLDALRIPYTGASTASLLAANDKRAAKKRIAAAGLPTPALLCDDKALDGVRAIVKPAWEHASWGMEDDAVIDGGGDAASIQRNVVTKDRNSGKPHFLEQYIDGREFNLSLLSQSNCQVADAPPEVLPPAEIDFSAYPVGKPHIVGSRAKWDVESFEYLHTPRVFDFPAEDASLLKELVELAAATWSLFGMTGYARVDFRVDRSGRPWILEINANPCLAYEAGFAAALAQRGISFDAAIDRIVADAISRSNG